MAVYDTRHNAFTPPSVRDSGLTGPRRSIQRILDLVDTADPAWPGIAAALREFVSAGIELDAASAEIAVKLGRFRWHSGTAQHEIQPTLASTADSIVYYIRRGALIKIGTTTEPRHRFRDLLPDEILAIEPGARELEQSRHRQFRHLKVRSEHFRDAPELLEHIRQVRLEHGEPDPSWPTIRTAEERWQLPLATSIDVLTVEEAVKQLGIKEGTLRAWASRGHLEPAGKDGRRVLYYREHLIRLRDSSHRRMSSV